MAIYHLTFQYIFKVCRIWSQQEPRKNPTDVLSNKDKLSIKQRQKDNEFSVSDHIFNVKGKSMTKNSLPISVQTSITEIIESKI